MLMCLIKKERGAFRIGIFNKDYHKQWQEEKKYLGRV
jgi:hypothetical protein